MAAKRVIQRSRPFGSRFAAICVAAQNAIAGRKRRLAAFEAAWAAVLKVAPPHRDESDLIALAKFYGGNAVGAHHRLEGEALVDLYGKPSTWAGIALVDIDRAREWPLADQFPEEGS